MRGSVVVGIQEQAKRRGTPLSRFLDEHLPHRDPVVEAWTTELASASRDGASTPAGGRDSIGWALELRIGLDLADAPPRLQELSYLPIDRCAALLAAAGFEHAPIGKLHTNGTTDPVLQRWTRTHHPIDVDESQLASLSACLLLDSFSQPMHRWGTKRTVDERRSLFASALLQEADLYGNAEILNAFHRCWAVYLDRGRQGLLALGDKVIVAPEMANGYGVVDLVIGRTLVDVKLAIEPTDDDVAAWLRQLLGYVLLDRFDTFRFDAVAIYCGWRGQVLTWPLSTLLRSAASGPAPTLANLRADFHKELREDLDRYASWEERERYN
ncbi:hypothetical protein SAMN04488074_1357 [Lentzea albidocapillata subsp. violacea]|uniref:Uncharacterized protein n=1 Tax=Lentzea albidocapillata subsp. violacea TaxID=128104 RepID=A0A1G9YQW9_9PSEU|nr:hypothetical protein SAMN04488074_1357 [Lentzea albidocapillata subsp. violacea]